MCNLDEISGEKISFLQCKIIQWGKDNFADYPWRKTTNKWHAIVAEIMLQRTNADQVVKSFNSFSQKYRSPEDFLNDPEAKIFTSLGLLWRENVLKQLAASINKNKIPEDKKTLLILPGIGDYISAAFRSLHLNIKDTIIDSNVVRIYGRFFGFNTTAETRRKKNFIELAEKTTPEKNFKNFNYGLIDFTRMICKKKADCIQCPIKELCKNKIIFPELKNK